MSSTLIQKSPSTTNFCSVSSSDSDYHDDLDNHDHDCDDHDCDDHHCDDHQ